MWVFPKNRGKTPKMDGANNGSKPYEQMDDFGGFPIFLEIPMWPKEQDHGTCLFTPGLGAELFVPTPHPATPKIRRKVKDLEDRLVQLGLKTMRN